MTRLAAVAVWSLTFFSTSPCFFLNFPRCSMLARHWDERPPEQRLHCNAASDYIPPQCKLRLANLHFTHVDPSFIENRDELVEVLQRRPHQYACIAPIDSSWNALTSIDVLQGRVWHVNYEIWT